MRIAGSREKRRAVFLLPWALSMLAFAQDEPKPKARPTPTPAPSVQKPVSSGASILVSCDLPRDWAVDGKQKRKLGSGGAAHAELELGQHFLTVNTLDGKDHYERDFILQSTEQTLIKVKLGPIREQRLQKERQEQTEREKADREKAETQEKEREWKEIDDDRREHSTWFDPTTGLMRTKRDSSKDAMKLTPNTI
jgi:hypothetical protein